MPAWCLQIWNKTSVSLHRDEKIRTKVEFSDTQTSWAIYLFVYLTMNRRNYLVPPLYLS